MGISTPSIKNLESDLQSGLTPHLYGVAGPPYIGSWWKASKYLFFKIATWSAGKPSSAVPIINGLFAAAQKAKWLLLSAMVKLPLPISSMSASLWPQKLTLLSRKEFSFRISATRAHQGVMSPVIRQELPTVAPHSSTSAWPHSQRPK